MEDVNARQRLSFSFPEHRSVFWNSTPAKIAKIRRIERDGISAIEFEEAEINFLSDVS